MIKRLGWLILLAGLFLLVQPVLAAAPLRAEIDPRVWQELTDHPTAALLIRLREPASALTLPDTADPAAHFSTTQQIDQRIQQVADAQSSLRASLDSAGQSFRSFWIINAISLQAERSLLETLAARADILYIESDRAFSVPLETPDSPAVIDAPPAVEPGLVLVHAPDLWNLGIKGSGAVVASADTGVQWDHPALKAQYRGWNGATADHNYNWWDAIHSQISNSPNTACGYNTQAPCDDYGHGTHTVGTMVGDDGAGRQIGMAPGAKWIACRNMDNGVGRPTTYIECLQFFIAPTDLNGKNPDPTRRPFVIDNSYGCPSGELCTSNSLHDAVTQVRNAGIFMAVSAGNSGPGCSSIGDPPAIEPGVFTVGGINAANRQIYNQSSRGPVTYAGQTYIKPALIAPAVNVISSIRGSLYSGLTGTSMAAPHVAGAVALLWSNFPTLRRDVLATEELLQMTAAPFTTADTCGGIPSGTTPNNTSGWGLLDVLAACNHWPGQACVLKKTYFPAIIQ